MSQFSVYLDRQQKLSVTDYFPATENRNTFFVTIPCYDEPELLKTLNSLAECKPPSAGVSVVVVVNSSDKSPLEVLESNLETISSVVNWMKVQPPFYQLRLLHAQSLPSKWAGVGWARKIAMDEAIRCLNQSDQDDGIIAAFDADSLVSPNYFTKIEETFRRNPRYNFVNLNFCHPVDDPSLEVGMQEGIILYELYLRYLRNAMQWCGYPHAIHTVGSSFAVRASAYVKQGGMNRRQAGEDFHFLHKIVLLGDYGHISDATVYPAARVSHRVPFGTGAALQKWREGNIELKSAYSLKIFETLKPLFADPCYFFKTESTEWENWICLFDKRLQDYIRQTGTLDRLIELKKNCADIRNFVNRFYHQVNAFWIIQYLNLSESNEGGKGILAEEAAQLLTKMNIETSGELTVRELLEIFRKIDNEMPKSD